MTAREQAEEEMDRLLSRLNREEKALALRVFDKILPSEQVCWIWHGSKKGREGKAEYPRIHLSTNPVRRIGVARLMYTLFVGPVPHNSRIRHHCSNPSCVNPSHLLAQPRR